MSATISITPLRPPFPGDRVVFVKFDPLDKILALSPEDYANLLRLLGGKPFNRNVVLECDPTDPAGIRILIHVEQ